MDNILDALHKFYQMSGSIGIILIVIGFIGITIIIYKLIVFSILGVLKVYLRKPIIMEKLQNVKENDIEIYCQYYISKLQQGFTILGIIVTIAPLLGLLGTVIGMVEAFQVMSSLGDNVNVSSLATGIWKALITTATGLIVAIPIFVSLNILQDIVEKHIIKLNLNIHKINIK